jgi:16S rRNA (adenine1518-N6/adenine1519-N6)-dimethyltransferase
MPSRLPPALKRLGQHFLIDQNIVRKIVALADLQPSESVLEIGPGRGILTRALCAKVKRVLAIEIDPQLVALLTGEVQKRSGSRWQDETAAGGGGALSAECPNLDLRLGDALEFPYNSLPRGTVVVSNLPYNVSTPILFRLLDADTVIDRMVLMLQTEVAARLAARPSTPDYGILSVLAQYQAEVRLAFKVSPNCFRPRPEVGSTVVSLKVRRTRSLARDEEERFRRIVRASFAHRRKTLANSLRDEGYLPDTVSKALTAIGIASTRRAESLTVGEFVMLARSADANSEL